MENELLYNLFFILRVSRIYQWAVFLFIYLFAFKLTGLEYSFIILLQAFSLTFPLQLFSNGINDIYDYETDIFNDRKKIWFMGAIVEKNQQELVLRASFLAAIFVMVVSIFTFNIYNFLYILLGLIICYIYSAPPVRLKNRPILGLLTYPIGFIGLIGVGYSFSNPIPPTFLLVASLSTISFACITFVLDHEADKRSDLLTISTKYSKRIALFISLTILLLILLSNIFGSMVNNLLIFYIFGHLMTILYPKKWMIYTLMTLVFAGGVGTFIIKYI